MRSNVELRQRILSGGPLAIQLMLGLMFLMSSLPKIQQPYDFLTSVYRYELVSPRLGVWITAVLPWLELLMAVCLIGRIFVTGATLICIGLSAMFIAVTAWALYQGLNISCGCFNLSVEDKINHLTLIRTVLIFLASVVAYISAIGLMRKKVTDHPVECAP